MGPDNRRANAGTIGVDTVEDTVAGDVVEFVELLLLGA
jgi:hypothetical protein